MKGKVIFGVLAVVLTGLIIAACSGGNPMPGTETPTLLPPVIADSAVIAEGKVVPVQYAQAGFPQAGMVAEVLVVEGESVKAGDVIARLDGTERAEAAVAASKLELLSAEQALDDLYSNAEVAKAAAELRLATAEQELEKATNRRASKDYIWGDQEQIDIAWANLVAQEDAVDQAEDAFSFYADRPETDPDRAYMLSLLANARQTRDKAKANYNYLVSKPDQLDINEADAKLAVAQAEADAARAELDKVKNGPDPDALALAEARVVNAEAQVASAQASLADLILTAPFDGVVVDNPLKVGELYNPGVTPVVIADLSKFKVETTDLTELNVIKISEGEVVKVTFDALPDLELTGTVSSIKSLGEDRLGDITYTVEVMLDEQDPALRWNMTAVVTFE